MARIRSIKPEFPHSESMGRVSRDARLTFIELWTLADDAGRLRGKSRMLASLLFPYDDDARELIDTWLGELEREDCIHRYQVDGDTYIQISNWGEHQKIDRPSKSKIPEPPSRALASPREDSRDFDEHSTPTREASCEDLRKGRDLYMSAPPPDVSRVFDHWKQVHGHPQSNLDEKRSKVIRLALASYSPDQLCQSISGYKLSPHHMGKNERNTVYDDIELFLRDAKHIDAGIKFAKQGVQEKWQ
jgi:hypothetical protein